MFAQIPNSPISTTAIITEKVAPLNVVVQAVTEGGVAVVDPSADVFVLDPVGTVESDILGGITIELPEGRPNQKLVISSMDQILTVAFRGSIIGAPISIQPESPISLIYIATHSAWVRC